MFAAAQTTTTRVHADQHKEGNTTAPEATKLHFRVIGVDITHALQTSACVNIYTNAYVNVCTNVCVCIYKCMDPVHTGYIGMNI